MSNDPAQLCDKKSQHCREQHERARHFLQNVHGVKFCRGGDVSREETCRKTEGRNGQTLALL